MPWLNQMGVLTSPCPVSTSSANGIKVSPTNCSMVPVHMNGTRRQPKAERWVSERNPVTALKGATSKGIATISATSQAATPNSTIMTRLSVPTISAADMPTVT